MASNYNRKSASSGSRSERAPRSRATSAGGPRAASMSSSRAASRTSSRKSSANPSRRQSKQSGGFGAFGNEVARRSSRSDSNRKAAKPRSESRRSTATPRSDSKRFASKPRPEARRATAASRLSSVRVGDLSKRGEGVRRRPQAERAAASGVSSKVLLPAIVVGAILAVMLVVVMVLRSSSVFAIENIEVNGVDHLTNEEMMALINVPEGTTLLQVDTGAIEQSLLRDAWIESVDVVLSYPHTLTVNVTERVIRAVVEVPTEDGTAVKRWAVAEDGMWLMPIPDQDSEAGQRTSQQIYDDIATVLTITDVPYTTQPEMGTYCTDQNVLNALDIVVGLTTELSNQVKSVAAAESETTITLDNGIEIVFGSADNIRDKERVALMIMEENEGSLAYINVSNPKAPTWRSV